jgi:hypothetical protein
MAGEAESLGELSRIVASLKDDIREDFASLNKKIDGLNVVHTDVYVADRHTDAERHKRLSDKVDRIEADVNARADEADLAALRANLRQLVFVVVGMVASIVVAIILAGVRT